jgi:uncharacterized protein (DUF1501 family)
MFERFSSPPMTRRESLQLAAAGVGGVSFSQWLPMLAAHAAESQPKPRHKSCILLWMDGGPSQHDTFDPKPEAPAEFRGPYRPIATSVPGLHIAEGYARLSQFMHHAAVIRGMRTEEAAEHLRGRVYMHTGYRPGFGGLEYPSMGALVAAHRPQGTGLPNYVVTGTTMQGFPHVAGGGFLGPRHNGVILRDPQEGMGNSRPHVDPAIFEDRLALADRLAHLFQRTAPVAPVSAQRTAYQAALDLMRSDRSQAFDLSREADRVRDRYGRHEFGQGCLLARRLVEAGVPFVEVYLSDWDTHEQRRTDLVRDTLLPVSDQAMTALLTDLIDRRMLDDTLVVWMGEFGRTPQCSPGGARGHFDKAWSTVLFGGGVRGGQVIGRTDAKGGEVVDRPVSGPDFMATVLSLLGLDPTSDLYAGARPVRMVAPGGAAIKELERV